MQKVLRRTEHAQRLAARRSTRARQTRERDNEWNARQVKIRQNRVVTHNEKEARRNRQVDWNAGPLAPRRDVGENAVKFGSMNMYNIQPAEVAVGKRPSWFHIAEGDRVVVTRGKDKGRIGIVQELDKERVAVKVDGCNQVDVYVPEWLRRQQQTQDQEITTANRLISLEDIKLVYALPDARTGEYRDTIIEQLTCVDRKFDKDKREWDNGSRVITGTKTIIPWPEKAEEQFEDHDVDTLRMSVEEKSFRPFLLHPPMPLSVIDELRNKYSKFRTRHDYDYLRKKEMEDAKTEDRKSLIKTMQTPSQELAKLRSKEKLVPELSVEQLAKIGQVIAQEQAKGLKASREG